MQKVYLEFLAASTLAYQQNEEKSPFFRTCLPKSLTENQEEEKRYNTPIIIYLLFNLLKANK